VIVPAMPIVRVPVRVSVPVVIVPVVVMVRHASLWGRQSAGRTASRRVER
jgi:hypothetical protein